METVIYINGRKCSKIKFKKEDELENLMIKNHKILFGNKTIFIKKTKIKNQALGNAIPDGFLFDIKDTDNPQFYLIEVELAKHDFYKHIFPQITKFIAFFNNSENRKQLIDRLFETVNTNKEIEKEFRTILGKKEIYKIITDAVENSQNIILVIDKNKPEIDEAKKAYIEWDKLVKVELLNQYRRDNNILLTLTPSFEEVEIADSPNGGIKERYDEEYHLESANEEIKKAYYLIKRKLLEIDNQLIFNPQHYYISIVKKRNFAYIQIRKTKLHIVITLPYSEGQKIIKNHKISTLSKGIQNFYNSECFKLTIENSDNLDEVINLLKINSNK
ncbi:MAG: hypothetical protein J7K54_00360 [Candidatus Aenigmarchaeota archaeon]|nr:hypothetical protein [Candidatus Aenigmarchaeota archaeon]